MISTPSKTQKTEPSDWLDRSQQKTSQCHSSQKHVSKGNLTESKMKLNKDVLTVFTYISQF